MLETKRKMFTEKALAGEKVLFCVYCLEHTRKILFRWHVILQMFIIILPQIFQYPYTGNVLIFIFMISQRNRPLQKLDILTIKNKIHFL